MAYKYGDCMCTRCQAERMLAIAGPCPREKWVNWMNWKRHLIVCASCTAGDVCKDGRAILGDAEHDDAPWLRGVL